MQVSRAIIISQSVSSFDQIEVLLHLDMDLLCLLLVLIDNLGQALIVGLLLLCLLALGAIRDTDLSIFVDGYLKFLRLSIHLCNLLLHQCSQIIVVFLSPNILFQVDQVSHIVLKFSQLTFDLDISRSQGIW